METQMNFVIVSAIASLSKFTTSNPPLSLYPLFLSPAPAYIFPSFKQIQYVLSGFNGFLSTVITPPFWLSSTILSCLNDLRVPWRHMSQSYAFCHFTPGFSGSHSCLGGIHLLRWRHVNTWSKNHLSRRHTWSPLEPCEFNLVVYWRVATNKAAPRNLQTMVIGPSPLTHY